MTPKEELIQAIKSSPDEIVQQLLEVLQALQYRQSLEEKKRSLRSEKLCWNEWVEYLSIYYLFERVFYP